VGRKAHARALGVWINGLHAADWKIPARGDVELQYQRGWLEAPEGRALSISLPFSLDNSPIKGGPVRCYFDNLLPDSEAIRQRIKTRYHTTSGDAFDLLAAIGRECVGAVQLLPRGEEPKDVHKISAQPLTDAQIERALIAVTAPAAPAGAREDEFRISIAGAQEKSAFLFHKGRWCRPLGATPTTHIFKLPLGLIGGVQADMSGSVENEWLCSRILHHYNLPIAACQIGRFGSQKALVVERFDRQLHSSGKYWLRLVQEDFCQALSLPSSMKYEEHGGPGIAEIAEVLRKSTHRDADLNLLLKSQILFWLLAAGDGHAKNFSLRISAESRYRLAPLYDVLSYWPIIGRGANRIALQKARLAMAVRGKNKHYFLTEVRREHFNETAARIGVGRDAEAIITEVLSRTPAVVAAVQKEIPKGFPGGILDPILTGLTKQARDLEKMAP
jgi:serine/threonine-protein kinase HipA